MSNQPPPQLILGSDDRRQPVPSVYDPMGNQMVYGDTVSGSSAHSSRQPMRPSMMAHQPPPLVTGPNLLRPHALEHPMQLSPHSPNHPQGGQLPQLSQLEVNLPVGPIEEGTVATADGFPTPAQFEDLLNEYILSLSPKKRDKALIPQKRYDNILAVLKDPKCTTIESAQFRFWAKKMFRLVMDDDGQGIVCHEGKPVAVREQLYDVLTTAHGQASHGGRDKTSAQVRKYYSWVPKELIARFVKNCPSCSLRRGSAPGQLDGEVQQPQQQQLVPGLASPSSPQYPHTPNSQPQYPASPHSATYPTTPNSTTLSPSQSQQRLNLMNPGNASGHANMTLAASQTQHSPQLPSQQPPPQQQQQQQQQTDTGSVDQSAFAFPVKQETGNVEQATFGFPVGGSMGYVPGYGGGSGSR